MLIAQLSDLHISTVGSQMDRVHDTATHLARALRHLGQLVPRPDLVVISGDLVERGGRDEYARLTSLLEGFTLPLALLPGNHDEREALRTAFPSQGWTGPFLQRVLDVAPLRVLTLDTLSPGKPGGVLCTERLAWLDARLSERPSTPTLVFLHHPPFKTGNVVMDSMGLESGEALAAVLRRHTHVECVSAGHVHRHMTRRFANTLAMTCPSTAHQVALTLEPRNDFGVVMEPPAALLHHWDGTSLVTHLSVIGERVVFQLHDGTQWLAGDEPPAGYR